MSDKKICTKCRTEKSVDCFCKNKTRKDGLTDWCNDCIAEYRLSRKDAMREYRENNKTQIQETNSKYKKSHREQQRNSQRKYVENNKEKILENQRKRRKERFETEPLYKLKEQARRMIWLSFYRTDKAKREHTEKIIGCTLEQLTEHLVKTFFGNYGVEYDGTQDVHIDHIIPISTAETEEDVYRLCHYSNLQLLYATDNIRKNARLDYVLGGEMNGE